MNRLSKYEPNWTGIGENIAMTYSDAAGDPMAALKMWLGSSGHCSNIYSGQYNHMGTGARGRYWTQDFVSRSAYTSNPFYDGTHYRHSTRCSEFCLRTATPCMTKRTTPSSPSYRTGGKLRFMVSFKSSGAPQVCSNTLIFAIDSTLVIHRCLPTNNPCTTNSPSACTSTA